MNENIYHYCSVDTLEKILANRTIRFSRFDKMDDQTETVGLPEMLKKNVLLIMLGCRWERKNTTMGNVCSKRC